MNRIRCAWHVLLGKPLIYRCRCRFIGPVYIELGYGDYLVVESFIDFEGDDDAYFESAGS